MLTALGLTLVAALTGCRRSPSETPSGSDSSGSTVGTPTGTATSPTPTPKLADPFPPGLVNILVFGTDARDESMTGNADALILCQVSADRSQLALVSIARDTYVPINAGHGKINSSFPMGGTSLLVETVSNLLGGIPIHLTCQSNFTGFINITRWLGGIRVFNRHASTSTVQSTGRVVDFPEGEILLENTDALIYARQRKELPLGDLDRAERHRALITGMLKGLKVLTATPTAFNDIAVKVFNNTKSAGITADQVPALLDVVRSLDTESVLSVMVPITRFDTVDGASVDILDEPQTVELGAALAAGTMAEYVATHGTDYSPGAS